MKAKQQPKAAPVEVPAAQPEPSPDPVDVMEREIPPEVVELRYELIRWVGDDSEDQLEVTARENYLMRNLVRILRTGGWIAEFLAAVIRVENSHLSYSDEPRFTPEQVRQMVNQHARAAA